MNPSRVLDRPCDCPECSRSSRECQFRLFGPTVIGVRRSDRNRTPGPGSILPAQSPWFYLTVRPWRLCRRLSDCSRAYSTAATVLLGVLAPALFVAMMRYSQSLPRSWLLSVASDSMAIAASVQVPVGCSRRSIW